MLRYKKKINYGYDEEKKRVSMNAWSSKFRRIHT
jgi:hypothetical protein